MELFDGGTLSHAYIVSGPEESGRDALAFRLARAFVCAAPSGRPCGACADCRKAEKGLHPDIITVDREPQKREIYVDRIRAVRADAAVLPNEAARKVYVILHADSMNAQAQNALLKTLEEPPAHAAFVLSAENPAALLPTVRSRCEELTAAPTARGAEITERARDFAKTMSHGDKTALVGALFALERMEKSDLADFLSELRQLAAAGLRGEDDCAGLPRERLAILVRALDRADVLSGFSVGAGHIAGLLMSELA